MIMNGNVAESLTPENFIRMGPAARSAVFAALRKHSSTVNSYGAFCTLGFILSFCCMIFSQAMGHDQWTPVGLWTSLVGMVSVALVFFVYRRVAIRDLTRALSESAVREEILAVFGVSHREFAEVSHRSGASAEVSEWSKFADDQAFMRMRRGE